MRNSSTSTPGHDAAELLHFLQPATRPPQRRAWLRINVPLLVLVAIMTISAAPPIQSPRQQHARFIRQITVEIDYLLFLPEGYEQKESWPLMLFLHGAGERGNDLEQVKLHGPPKIVETQKDFPFIVVSPQCKPNRRWDPLELTALLDEIVAKYHVDQERIYVTGLSMGGAGTWSLAVHTPDRFAAIVPICGSGDVQTARALAKLPIWVFHGAKDQAVPLKRSEDMVEALRAQGSSVKFTVYPDAGHDSWSATYANSELYEWLLQQRSTKNKK